MVTIKSKKEIAFMREVCKVVAVVYQELEQNVKPGDVITMKAGSKHTIIANDELKVIEVQIGKEISVSDKQEFDK